MRRTLRLAALVLPLAGLAALWGWSDHESRQGTDWDVPVEGYDPRDLLRGHYIEFIYVWPGEVGEEDAYRTQFCIEGTPPVIERVVPADDIGKCAHPLRARGSEIYGMDGLQRGRLYIPQARSAELQAKLLDLNLRGMVRIRQRDDGLITPQQISFRPLTAEELAARTKPADAATPPPVEISPAN